MKALYECFNIVDLVLCLPSKTAAFFIKDILVDPLMTMIALYINTI